MDKDFETKLTIFKNGGVMHYSNEFLKRGGDLEHISDPTKFEFQLEQFRELKDKKDILNQELKLLQRRIDYQEEVVLAILQEEGIDKASIKGIGTASIKVDEHPAIKDWDAFFDYIKKNPNSASLLKKAINAASWREEVQSGHEVPGVEGFKRTKLLFRRS